MERISINQMIGDYRVTGFLGAGGMGEVYQGIHSKIGRVAAIKVLHKMSPSSSLTARFINEARVQSSIYHPNIAALYDFQETADNLFIFMEFVNGESLEEMIARRAFMPESALKSFQAICEAVAFIHERGIIHRDIKGQNIKFTSEGTVKLLDFGIAKDAASQNLTKVGGVIGTPQYLAPEQLNGSPATPQTDIWALGILLYQMLTGAEPFHSDSLALLYLQINDARYEKPEKLNPQIPSGVSQIVMRCLNANTMMRYRSVKEILEDVRRALNQFVSERESAFSERQFASDSDNLSADNLNKNLLVAAPPRRSPLIAIAAGTVAAVFLLFILIGVGAWIMSDSNSRDLSTNNSVASQPTKKIPLSRTDNSVTIQPSALSESVAGKITIDSFGGSAEVFREEERIGVTPLNLEAKNGDVISITLKRVGYEDKQVNFSVTPGQRVYTFSMTLKK